MKIHSVRGDDLFRAALENADAVRWVFWSEGICAFLEEEGSVLCHYPDQDCGFLLVGIQKAEVFALSDRLVVVCSDGVFDWDGRAQMTKSVLPIWPKLTVSDHGYCGWYDFRYHVVFGSSRHRLPLAANNVRFFPDEQKVFWQYWGTWFTWTPSGSQALQAVAEDHEKIIPLCGGWLVLVYERSIAAIHSMFPKKEWSNVQLLDVIPSQNSSSLQILLADGSMLRWMVSETPEPDVWMEEVPGDMFIGYEALLVEDELLLLY